MSGEHTLDDLFSSVLISCSVVSNSLWPHGLQHSRLPCPSATPGAYSNSIESVMPSNLLILCHPLLLPSIFSIIRVFSSESVLRIGWSKVDDLSPFKFVETCLILHTTRAVLVNLAFSACGENEVISLVSLLMRPLIPFMKASPSWPKCFPQSTSSK